MSNVSVYNMEGNEVGTLELNDAVFGVEVNEHLVHMAVVRQLANKRQGTQKAKTRSEVSGGGRKPWRQKGTGHARQGSTRAPQWTGGGVVFAPVPRDYSFKMNKKERRIALKSALTTRVQENKLVVLDELKLDAIKTKDMQNVLNNLKVEKAMVVTDNENVIVSARNIPNVITASVGLRDEKFYGKQKERKTIDFLGKRKLFFTISVILILLVPVGMGVFHAKDGKALNYSLEFIPHRILLPGTDFSRNPRHRRTYRFVHDLPLRS